MAVGFGYRGGPLADDPTKVQSLTVYMKGDGMWSAGAYIKDEQGVLVWREHDYRANEAWDAKPWLDRA